MDDPRFKSAVECSYFNVDVRETNKKSLLQCTDVFVCNARDFDEEKAIETKFDAPIDKAIEYGLDLRVMLTSNLAPHLGLANGT